MEKRIQKLIAGGSYALANRPQLGGVAASGWTAGSLQIFKDDYTAYDGAAADATYDGPIAIGRYDATNDVYMTEFIKKGSIKNVTIQDYVAPVLQRVDVDLSGISNTAGEEVGVRLINKNNREVIYIGRRVYVVTAGASLTATIDAVAAAINSDTFNDATAVNSGGTALQITAAAFDPELHVSEPYLSVSAVEGWSSAPVSTGVAAVSGVGTSDKVTLIEELEDWGESQGISNFREFVTTPASAVVAGTEYNLITIEYSTDHGDTVISSGDKAPKTVVIAMDSAGTGNALIKSNLQVWLNVAIDDLPS
jgi:hypothetical protein